MSSSRGRRGGALVALLLCAGCSAGAPATDVQIPDTAPTGGAGAMVGDRDGAATAPAGEGASEDVAGSTATPTEEVPVGDDGPDGSGALYVVPDRPVVAPGLPAYELEVRAPEPDGDEEADVLAAWEAFWERIVDGSGIPEHRPGPMGAVATDVALVDAEQYVSGLVDARQRVTGRLVLVADTVEVDGASATVAGCSDQRDHEVGADGGSVSEPEGPSDLATRLVKDGDRWQVSLWGVRGPC